MHFSITKENLLEGLHFVAGVVERRQNMPILANVLLQLDKNRLYLTATDFEIELTSSVETTEIFSEALAVTVQARKLIDICRSLPAKQIIIFQIDPETEKIILLADKSRFILQTLPVQDFPLMSMTENSMQLTIQAVIFMQLISQTCFSMGNQDARYYLNGLSVKFDTCQLSVTATDGHRLSMNACDFRTEKPLSFILPRKGVLELVKLLHAEDADDSLRLYCAENMFKIEGKQFSFVSRLIDSRMPDYSKIIPTNADKKAIIQKQALQQVLQRVGVLTHEKYRIATLHFANNLLSLRSSNEENEESSDELAISYQHAEIETVFNIQYVLDILAVLPEGEVMIEFSEPDESVLITSENLPEALYVIMPMSV